MSGEYRGQSRGGSGLLPVLLIVSWLSSCGDDSGPAAPLEGCGSDSDCKGERICMGGECVDPDDPGGGGSGRSSSSGRDGGAAQDSGSAPSGGSAAMPIDDPELEQACISDCEARQVPACTMNLGSLDQCMAQCLIIDEANQGYCLEEQTDLYACRASGGYSCVSGYPMPKATCLMEAQEVSKCSLDLPCRRYCDMSEAACTPDGEECLANCRAQQTGFEDLSCMFDYNQLLACWTQNGTCQTDQPAAEPCAEMVAEVADCIASRNHACDGFCWAAELLGCGSEDCVSTCMATSESSTICGSYYRNLMSCTFQSRDLRLACVDGVPTPTAECDSAAMQYESCMP